MKVSESIIQLKRQSNEDNHAHNIATIIIFEIHLNTFTRTRTCIVQFRNDIMENLVIFFITNNIQLKIHSQGLCWMRLKFSEFRFYALDVSNFSVFTPPINRRHSFRYKMILKIYQSNWESLSTCTNVFKIENPI